MFENLRSEKGAVEIFEAAIIFPLLFFILFFLLFTALNTSSSSIESAHMRTLGIQPRDHRLQLAERGRVKELEMKEHRGLFPFLEMRSHARYGWILPYLQMQMDSYKVYKMYRTHPAHVLWMLEGWRGWKEKCMPGANDE